MNEEAKGLKQLLAQNNSKPSESPPSNKISSKVGVINS